MCWTHRTTHLIQPGLLLEKASMHQDNPISSACEYFTLIAVRHYKWMNKVRAPHTAVMTAPLLSRSPNYSHRKDGQHFMATLWRFTGDWHCVWKTVSIQRIGLCLLRDVNLCDPLHSRSRTSLKYAIGSSASSLQCWVWSECSLKTLQQLFNRWESKQVWVICWPRWVFLWPLPILRKQVGQWKLYNARTICLFFSFLYLCLIRCQSGHRDSSVYHRTAVLVMHKTVNKLPAFYCLQSLFCKHSVYMCILGHVAQAMTDCLKSPLNKLTR